MWPPFYLSSNRAVFLDLLTKLLAGCCQSLFGYLPSTQESFGDCSHSLLIQQIPIRRNCKNEKLKRKRIPYARLSGCFLSWKIDWSRFHWRWREGYCHYSWRLIPKYNFQTAKICILTILISNKMVHLVKVPLKQWLVVQIFSDCVISQNSDWEWAVRYRVI